MNSVVQQNHDFSSLYTDHITEIFLKINYWKCIFKSLLTFDTQAVEWPLDKVLCFYKTKRTHTPLVRFTDNILLHEYLKPSQIYLLKAEYFFLLLLSFPSQLASTHSFHVISQLLPSTLTSLFYHSLRKF